MFAAVQFDGLRLFNSITVHFSTRKLAATPTRKLAAQPPDSLRLEEAKTDLSKLLVRIE